MENRINEMPAKDAITTIADNIKARDVEKAAGSYLFLLGAGASHSCGIPLGNEIAQEIEKEIKSGSKASKWKEFDINKGMSEYEWAMSQIEREKQIEKIREFIRYARLDDGRWKLNYCYYVLSELWKQNEGEEKKFRNYPRVLLTTNFDPLFNYALHMQNIEPKIIRHPNELNYMYPFETEFFPTIIHLHGYWQNHNVAINNDDWQRFKDAWVVPLSSELARFGLVVIGYEGVPEDIALRTLSKIHSNKMTMSSYIFWCYRKQINGPTYALLSQLKNVYGVQISDADDFMLSLGMALDLGAIKNIRSFSEVIKSLSPGFVECFMNNATVEIDSHSSISNGVCIKINTIEGYKRPGENYAGIAINAIKKYFDLSKWTHAVIEYDAHANGNNLPPSPTFEFKFQTNQAAHIVTLPVGNQMQIKVPLEEYKNRNVELDKIEKIIIACNCEQIGDGSKIEICIREINWI